MRWDWTKPFERDFERLSHTLQRTALRKLELLTQNPRHPSLRVKKLRAVDGIYEGSVNMQYRFLFRVTDDTIRLLHIGPHKILDDA